MSFCKLSAEYVHDGFTLIDNTFFVDYFCKTDSIYLKVYFFGLYISKQPYNDFDLEKMAIKLSITVDKLLESFKFWEEKGLVRISKTQPVEIEYLSCKRPQTAVIKRNAKNYSEFCDECQRLFPANVIMPNSYERLFEVIETYKMDIDAMLMAIRYCLDLKKGKPPISFIIAVAENWAKDGLLSVETVEKHIEKLENNSEDILQIFESLGIKRSAEFEDRQLFLKWTTEYNFTLDAILVASKICKKKGGMDKLNKVLEELIVANAFSGSEIDFYATQKEETLQLAIDIIKQLGGYYATLDIVVETYIIPWKNKGFNKPALLTIASLCFKSDIRTLSGMDNMIEKFFKMGIIEKLYIDNYIETQILIDKKVRSVLDSANSKNFVSKQDKDYYKTFVETWGFSHDVVLLVAEALKDTPYPMSAISKKLAKLKQNNVYDVDKVKIALTDIDNKNKDDKSSFDSREYSKEELNSVVVSLENVNIEDIDL